MHMETYQPLQMASLAFEVAVGSLNKKKLDKFRKVFEKKVLSRLEKNVLSSVDPSLDNYRSPFKKMAYKLPEHLLDSKN